MSTKNVKLGFKLLRENNVDKHIKSESVELHSSLDVVVYCVKSLLHLKMYNRDHRQKYIKVKSCKHHYFFIRLKVLHAIHSPCT